MARKPKGQQEPQDQPRSLSPEIAVKPELVKAGMYLHSRSLATGSEISRPGSSLSLICWPATVRAGRWPGDRDHRPPSLSLRGSWRPCSPSPPGSDWLPGQFTSEEI